MVDRRRRDHPDPFLDWKVRIFFAGAALLMAGILLQRDVLALVAIVVLAAGLLLALVSAVRGRRSAFAPPDEPDSDAGFEPEERI